MKQYGIALALIASVVMSPLSWATEQAKQQLQDKMQQLESVQASFEQTVTGSSGEVLQSLTGELALQRPAMLRWRSNPPDDTLLIADGESVWYYNPFVEQVTVYAQSNAVENSPLLLLMEGSKERWQQFDVTYDSAEGAFEVVNENTGSELNLSFTGDKLTRIVLKQKQGDTTIIALTDVVMNERLPNDLFQFDIPEGVEVDDQR
ncbi:outer membrane lipoprotein chaperone LolA [Idiomarina sp.]|jgi:outer membrane lipoprotein carrier protein|uniref:outer membrane lipoprotein chaperone LolA n=1 Tax=Idiomarina sp. TaxID=1874361 RepID=UPI002EBF1488|nr:outer membrane lipoprotein chaperone LolA [Pseudomonadota bacterium]